MSGITLSSRACFYSFRLSSLATERCGPRIAPTLLFSSSGSFLHASEVFVGFTVLRMPRYGIAWCSPILSFRVRCKTSYNGTRQRGRYLTEFKQDFFQDGRVTRIDNPHKIRRIIGTRLLLTCCFSNRTCWPTNFVLGKCHAIWPWFSFEISWEP